jgi:hypothetical protein
VHIAISTSIPSYNRHHRAASVPESTKPGPDRYRNT